MTTNIQDAKKLIWLTPERLGDALMGTAALTLLKQHCPDLQITLVATSQAAHQVYLHNPNITRHTCTPRPVERNRLTAEHNAVIHIHPDVSPDLRTLFDLPFFAPPNLREETHQSKVQLDFIADLLGLSESPDIDYTLNYADEDKTYINQLLQQDGVTPETILVGCSVGCHRLSRRGIRFWKPLTYRRVWSMDYIQQLEHLLRQHNQNLRIVLIGSGSEVHLAKKYMRNNPRAINMVNKTTIPQLAALVDQTQTIVSNDTGLLHVTCARGKNLIALHGASNPGRCGPFPLRDNRIIIKEKTMDAITPEMVAQHIIRLLQS